MVQFKYNDELMDLNRKQLEDQVTRSEVRRQRRQILEGILENREEFKQKGIFKKSKGLVTGLVVFAVVVVAAASYFLYLLTIE